jgi:outer membrane protein assembly factor BamB
MDAGAPFQAGSPWPKFRHDMAQTGLGTVHASAQGGVQWSFATGAGIFSSPVVGADGTIYFGSADQSFYALNPDGSLKWKIQTGEIIDSAGLLDDQGNIYFGSGDGLLRAADAQTGKIVWTFAADPPSATGYINWFEGNVAIGPTGQLYAPNDNFWVYAVDRQSGSRDWRLQMPDQTWSLPAVSSDYGYLYLGNNNLNAIFGNNTFAVSPDGLVQWSAFSPGTVAASPLLTQGEMVVGGFDGYCHAYSMADGGALWQLPTRDHIYASPALLPDGSIVQASVDGTVYDVSPNDGSLRWTLDTHTPIRSSPAVDADGHIYLGGGDGRLYVINPDGSLRFSILLIDDVRHNLNSSPALGQTAVYLGGESGAFFSVPYDFCLQSANASDPRCSTSIPPSADGPSLTWVNAFGDQLSQAPSSIEANAPIILQFGLRSGGQGQQAILNAASVTASLQPPADVALAVSGDGRFVSLTPTVPLPAGPISITVSAGYLVDLTRTGLALSGGTDGGSVSATFSTSVAAPGPGALDPTAAYEISRVSLPMPSVLPSYNQIGFDQLRYLLGFPEVTDGGGVAWMVGALTPPDGGDAVIDPGSQAIFPLQLSTVDDTATLTGGQGLQVTVTNYSLSLQSFRLSARFQAGGAPAGTTELEGSALCSDLGVYGGFLVSLGLCNPQTDELLVLGASNASVRRDLPAPPPIGTVAFAAGSTQVSATIVGSQVRPDQHLVGLLVVDANTGSPVTLEYGPSTTRSTASDGTLTSVAVPVGGVTLPSTVRVYLMVDTTAVASATLSP